MNTCPKCQRPINEGNSPNAEECHETDDDDGVCEAYAKVAEIRAAAQSILWMAKEYAEAGGSRGPEMRDYLAAKKVING